MRSVTLFSACEQSGTFLDTLICLTGPAVPGFEFLHIDGWFPIVQAN